MIDTWLPDAPSARVAPAARQYLSFLLGEQCFALSVAEVQEIRALGAWSTLPGSPAWVLGVMNLRGMVIPLVDLRLRFGIVPAQVSTYAVMIVVAAGGKLGGLVVDGVKDVVEIEPDAMKPPAGQGTATSRCVAGVATLEESVVVVLSAVSLFSADQGADGLHQGARCNGGMEPVTGEGGTDVEMVR